MAAWVFFLPVFFAVGNDESVAPLWLQRTLVSCRLRKEMTAEEVERILGKDSYPLPRVGLVGCVCWRVMWFDKLGLMLSLTADENGVFRLDADSLPMNDPCGRSRLTHPVMPIPARAAR